MHAPNMAKAPVNPGKPANPTDVREPSNTRPPSQPTPNRPPDTQTADVDEPVQEPVDPETEGE